MNHTEFIKNALKTESKVDILNIDKKVLYETLFLHFYTGELLDAIKKKAFYNNSVKYDNEFFSFIVAMETTITNLKNRLASLKTETGKENNPDINTRISHGLIGLMSESGELSEAFLRALVDKFDIVNIKEELFDMDWYKAIISDECDIDWEDGWEKIINKLKARFGDKFTEKGANNRDLETERKILEQNDE